MSVPIRNLLVVVDDLASLPVLLEKAKRCAGRFAGQHVGAYPARGRLRRADGALAIASGKGRPACRLSGNGVGGLRERAIPDASRRRDAERE